MAHIGDVLNSARAHVWESARTTSLSTEAEY